MKEFDYNGESKVRSLVLPAYLSAFGPYRQRGEKVLCKYFGVEKLSDSADAYYPLPLFLKAMEEFQRQFGREFMKKVGQGIFASAEFPPGIDSVEKVMTMLNDAYYMNHETKPGEIGGYHWHADAKGSGIMVCDNPYPCKFDSGLLEVLAKTFSQNSKVTHEDDKPCRHKGGDSCTYKVEW